VTLSLSDTLIVLVTYLLTYFLLTYSLHMIYLVRPPGETPLPSSEAYGLADLVHEEANPVMS